MSNVNMSYSDNYVKKVPKSNFGFSWYYHNVKMLRDIFKDASAGKELDYKKIRDLADAVYAGRDMDFRIISEPHLLSDCTYFHSVKTAYYAMSISEWLGLSGSEIKRIIMSSLLHDIGKAQIPKEILNKKGVLTKDEIKVIQKHPILGYKILSPIREIDPDIKNAVLLHHERLDGSGYPLNTAAENIGLYARIVAVADVFDAMISDRVYKKRVGIGDAVTMFETVGLSKFDSEIVNTLLFNISSVQ